MNLPLIQDIDALAIEPDRELLEVDWLIDSSDFASQVCRSRDGRELVLTNRLIRRAWRLTPNAACVAFDNLITGETILRAVRPEARITVNGDPVNVGGLVGQPNHAYLTREWLDNLSADPDSFRFVGFTVVEPEARVPWLRVRHHAPNAQYPPKGVGLELHFRPPTDDHLQLHVVVHYELYDGIPALCKWVTVRNDGDEPVDIDSFLAEIFAAVPYEDYSEDFHVPITPPNIHVETDYAFGGSVAKNVMRHSVHWIPDPDFDTQVSFRNQTPCLLHVGPEIGPYQRIGKGEVFESFRVFELVYDSTERERKGLALRRFYRTVAPWVTENPLILHVVSTDPEVVKRAVDQADECGFEMISLSFGSGLNMEDDSPANHAKIRDLVEYAKSKGIHMGGYSLLSSRRIQPDSDNIINPETGEPGGQTHGFCPALASNWGQNYFRKLRAFFENTGFMQFTHDGSYPGDIDAAARPPLQRGERDSQWVQWKIITGFYKWLRSRGVYLRVPDYYYLSGSNESGMGYREVNWSLPRIQQQIHTRQNIYDGTWEKTPSMGWMFVPLTQYHGGGAAATIEPLSEHLHHYEIMMASNLLAGVQAVYRGFRLYDTEETRELVRRMVEIYKRHRDILESDIIHLRRADGRDIDYILHVNPELEEKGFLAVFNPTKEDRESIIKVPLYYTGLKDVASVSQEDASPVTYELDRDYSIRLPLVVPAEGYTWFVIR